ncbi:hypothetical protein FIE12Z_7555 [Fusarium flagelliforme]|uniref:BTB domain-containing protein n=1 Tax=Fusarium flagelliforme TaxID=2675880 RepID=A0A395MK19_9HYPO|nr:hypothetical protein FIE12Z_7555 [Fusarium flagelliforme]
MEQANSFTTLTPNSDTDLILRNPNAWNYTQPTTTAESSSEDETAETSDRSTISETSRNVTKKVESIRNLQKLIPCEDGATVDIRFHVSSTHLILSSPEFANMLSGRWSEGRGNNENQYKIIITDWSAEALFILLNIIHGHHRLIASHIDFNTIVGLAMICNYYKCQERVETFVDKWLVPFQMERPTQLSPGTTMQAMTAWVFIAWVFNKEELFNELIDVALKNCRTPLTGHLSLPINIIERVEARRQHLMMAILDYVYTLHESLISHKDGCSHRCSTLLLGNLVKHIRLYGYNLARQQGQSQLTGRSWKGLKAFAQGIRQPTFSYVNGPTHQCRFDIIKTEAHWKDVAKKAIDGCRFQDFKRLF